MMKRESEEEKERNLRIRGEKEREKDEIKPETRGERVYEDAEDKRIGEGLTRSTIERW